MKRITLLFMFVLSAILCPAQQALRQTTNVLSPEIHADNTVTFRLYAPKAVKVQLKGDFSTLGTADMIEKENGVWEYTTPQPLEPELYCYRFIVNGLTINDPNNVYRIRDIVTVSNVFIIGGGQADLYQIKDVPHGTVSKVWYHSPTLSMNRRMTVYTRLQMY